MIVYYSIAFVEGRPQARQWLASVGSLRSENTTIPVHLFYYGTPPDFVHTAADVYNVALHDCGRYADIFGPSRPPGEGYEVLHKLRHGAAFPGRDSRVLYVDADTWFFDDVAKLFGKYASADFYAREEVKSSRSHYGYDPAWIDERKLKKLADLVGVRYVASINIGVMLINYGLCEAIASRQSMFLEDTRQLLDERLPYPTPSRWIADEIATLLMLGSIPDLTVNVFSRADVPQGAECVQDRLEPFEPILAHYWSGGERAFFESIGFQAPNQKGR